MQHQQSEFYRRYSLCGQNFRNRINKLIAMMAPGVAIMASSEPFQSQPSIAERFSAQSDFFYFTGIEEPATVVLFSNSHPQHRYVLFRNEVTEKEMIWNGPRLTNAELKEICGADAVFAIDELPQRLPEYLQSAANLYYSPGRYPQLDTMVFSSCRRLRRQNYQALTKPDAIWDVEGLIEDLRVCKDEAEISCLRRAAEITAAGYHQAMLATRPGVYEYELEALLYYTYRRHGARALSFPTIVASGANATILHYVNNDRCLGENELVLVDSGADYRHYCADVTRTWPVSGKFTPAQRQVYQAVLDAQTQSIAAIKPGELVEEFDRRATRVLTEHMLALKILTGNIEDIIAGKAYQKFYMHRTGHFIGLDVHDTGGYYRGKQPRRFEAGMVITVEPGIYISPAAVNVPAAFRGIGVRIEDDVLVTATGCEVLTADIPKEIDAIEQTLTGCNPIISDI